jgi:autotransporter adhesin
MMQTLANPTRRLTGASALGALAALAGAALLAPGMAQAQTATGVNSSAVGPNAQATGDSSTAEGFNSTASGLESTAIGFTSLANGRGANALGGRNKAGGTFSTAVGWANTAGGLDAFAGGNKSVASGVSTVAIGDVAQATGDLSVAIGARATAAGANSVALGADSVAADPNTVSVGSATAQRRITNVAAGTGANDVATFGQLQSAFGDFDQRLTTLSKRADTGTAAAMAIAGLPQAFAPGKGMVGVAIGTWRGEEAFALGASKVFGDSAVFKAGAAFDSHGTGGVNAGVGWQF